MSSPTCNVTPKYPDGPGERHRHPFRIPVLLKWLFYIAIAIFCLFRLGTFTPQPLDAAGTLRPVLYRWFVGFLNLHVHPEQAFSSWSRIGFLTLMIPPALAVLNYWGRSGAVTLSATVLRILSSRVLLFGSIAVCLLVCRYPILLENELNPDEGQFIASAHKLFYDSNYFRSVDCGTSGPLNIYPLMLPAVFGYTPDYASSRVIALILVFSSIYLLYRTIAILTAEDLARIAILPAVVAFATFKHRDLVHYSSEHVPLLLIALALYYTVRVLRSPEAYRVPVFVLGVIACAAFFAKMQAVPVVVAIGAIAVAYVQAAGIAQVWRPALLFLAGALPLAAANAVLCLLTGVWRDFIMAYLVTNQRYADLEGSIIGGLPRFISYLGDTIELRYLLFTFVALAAAYAFQRARAGTVNQRAAFLQMAAVSGIAVTALIFVRNLSSAADYSYVLWIVILVVPAYLILSYRRGLFGTEPVSWFGALSVASLGAALFSVYKAHRTFPHYLLLVVLPVCAGMAWMLMRQAGDGAEISKDGTSGRYAFVSLFIVLTLVYGCYVWGSQDDQAFKGIPYTIRPLEGNLIRAVTGPDAQIVVWGWTVRPYLGSGRVPATRDTNMANFFRWPEISNYYRERFLRDIRQNPAELFVDAIGPTSWTFGDRKLQGFELYPEIKAYVDAHYVYVAEVYEQRYYLRRDLLGKRPWPPPRGANSCQPGALRCLSSWSTEPRVLPSIRMPGHALLEIRLTPTSSELDSATVVSNEKTAGSFRGFQLFNTQGDAYRFAFGLGSDWAFSKDIPIKKGETAALWVELNGSNVTIRLNGDLKEQLHLPRPIVDSEGAITLGSWIEGERRFAGEIQLFQISDLEKAL